MSFKGVIYCLFIVCSTMFFVGCNEDEINKVAAISNDSLQLNKDRSSGVEIIYSDSALVKAKGFAPILDKVTEASGLIVQEMPKGVRIDFYQEGKIRGTITSDYAIRRESEKKTTFQKNVVVVYPEGRYVTEELVWDENRQVYLSPAGVYTKSDGTILNARNFVAAQDFSSVSMSTVSAEVYTNSP